MLPLLPQKQRSLRELAERRNAGSFGSVLVAKTYHSPPVCAHPCSCSRGTGLLAHERVLAFLDGGRLMLRCDHDGVLVHELTGWIGESWEGQGDPLHLTLINSLIMLFLQVTTPESKKQENRFSVLLQMKSLLSFFITWVPQISASSRKISLIVKKNPTTFLSGVQGVCSKFWEPTTLNTDDSALQTYSV